MIRSLVFIFLLFVKPAFSQKILIVSTNIDKLNNESNGTFFMEIADPFDVFIKAGIQVEIVTPLGGQAAIYHRGQLSNRLAAIQENETFKSKTSHTISPGQVQVDEFVGVFYPGGGGQFYDVFNNTEIASLASRIYEQGGAIGTTGHGPASLINVKLANGEYLVSAKRITCYPKAHSAKWLPFDWEEILRTRGAVVLIPETRIEKDKGIELLDRPNRLISGSYAENARWVAEQMILLVKSDAEKR